MYVEFQRYCSTTYPNRRKRMMRKIFCFLFLTIGWCTVSAQEIQRGDSARLKKKDTTIQVVPQQKKYIASYRADTTKREAPSSVPAGNDQLSAPSNYTKLIKPHALTRKGLFTVHRVDDNYYFEIPDSLLGRDLLV